MSTCERAECSRVDVIGVHPFEHEGFARQVGPQPVARMVGGRAQEEGHRVRVERLLRVHRSSQRVVIGFGKELEVRARFRHFVDLSLSIGGQPR